jgi:hypothetical protein
MDHSAAEYPPSDLDALRRQATFFGGEQELWDAALATVAVAMTRADVALPSASATLPPEARAKLMEALASMASGPTPEDTDQPAAR